MVVRGNASDVRAGGAFVEIGGDSRQLQRALRGAETRLNAFAQGAARIGTRLAAIGAAISAPLAIGVQRFSELSDQVSRVSTQLAGQDIRFLPEFQDDLRRLSTQFGQSTELISSGLFDILSASIPAEKAVDVLTESLKLAEAGFTDVSLTTDALTTIINAFRLEADQAADVADFLFQVNKRGKTTIAEISRAIGNVAATANSAGLSLDEMGAALSTLTRNGLKTDIAVTSLRGILNSFLKPQDSAVKAARKFGLELNTNTLRTIGLSGALQKLRAATPEELAEVFPSVEALTGINPLLGDLSGLLEDVALQSKRAGVTAEAFDKAQQSLSARFRQVKQGINDVFVGLGEALVPVLNEVIPEVMRLINALRDWIARNPQVVQGALAVAAGMVAIGTSLVGGAGLVVALSSLATALAGPAGIVAALTAVTAAVFKSFGAFGLFEDRINDAAKALTGFLKGDPTDVAAFKKAIAEITFEAKRIQNEVAGLLLGVVGPFVLPDEEELRHDLNHTLAVIDRERTNAIRKQQREEFISAVSGAVQASTARLKEIGKGAGESFLDGFLAPFKAAGNIISKALEQPELPLLGQRAVLPGFEPLGISAPVSPRQLARDAFLAGAAALPDLAAERGFVPTAPMPSQAQVPINTSVIGTFSGAVADAIAVGVAPKTQEQLLKDIKEGIKESNKSLDTIAKKRGGLFLTNPG